MFYFKNVSNSEYSVNSHHVWKHGYIWERNLTEWKEEIAHDSPHWGELLVKTIWEKLSEYSR